MDVEPRPEGGDIGLPSAGQMGQPRVGEALPLQPPQRPGAVRQAVFLKFRFRFDDCL
jgi:hypothetical protein